jgi:hypothetical protein
MVHIDVTWHYNCIPVNNVDAINMYVADCCITCQFKNLKMRTVHCPMHHKETVLQCYIVNTQWLAQSYYLWQMTAMSARVGKGRLQYSCAFFYSCEGHPLPVYMVVMLCQLPLVPQCQFPLFPSFPWQHQLQTEKDFQAISTLSVLRPGLCEGVLSIILKVGL